MNKTELSEIRLIGLALPTKTSNQSGQSSIDCGNLWQKFEKENYADKIPNKLNDEILAVYHQYDGDHTQPFSYFIGCKVKNGTVIPEGMDSMIIPQGSYEQIKSSGKMPDCVINTWREIWDSNIPRSYQTDFELYDERSKDWSSAVVDFFISIK